MSLELRMMITSIHFNTNVFESSDDTDNTDSSDTVMSTNSDDNDNTADNNYA